MDSGSQQCLHRGELLDLYWEGKPYRQCTGCKTSWDMTSWLQPAQADGSRDMSAGQSFTQADTGSYAETVPYSGSVAHFSAANGYGYDPVGPETRHEGGNTPGYTCALQNGSVSSLCPNKNHPGPFRYSPLSSLAAKKMPGLTQGPLHNVLFINETPRGTDEVRVSLCLVSAPGSMYTMADLALPSTPSRHYLIVCYLPLITPRYRRAYNAASSASRRPGDDESALNSLLTFSRIVSRHAAAAGLLIIYQL